MSSALKASVISGVKWLAFSKVLIQLFRWISTFWVIRLLFAEDYGVMAIAEIMCSLLASVNFLCIGSIIIRFKTISKPVMDTLFTCCLLIGLGLFCLQFFSANYFSQFYQTPEAKLVLQVIAISYLIEAFSVKPMALLAKNMQFKQLAIIDLTVGVLMPITVLVAAYAGLGYWALALGYLVNTLAKTLMANWIYPVPIKLRGAFSRVKPLLGFGLQNSGASVLAQLNNSLDFIVGGYIFSTAKIGSYQVGLQISLIPLRKISPELKRISFPAFSKINSNLTQTAHYYTKSLRVVGLIVFPIFWGLGLIAEPLVNVLLTDKWLESAAIIQILCFVLPFKLFTEMTDSMFNALGRADILLSNTFFASVSFAVALGVFLSLDIGITALAYSWVASILATYMLLLVRVTRLVPLTLIDIISAYKSSLVGVIAMAAVLLFISEQLGNAPSLTILVVLIVAGAVVYGGYILLFHRHVLKELKQLVKG